jgi:hypothetical protein
MIFFEMAATALDLGDPERAYRLVGVADSLRKSSGVDIVGLEFNKVEGLDFETLGALTGANAQALDEGRRLGVQQAVAYALIGPTDRAD